MPSCELRMPPNRACCICGQIAGDPDTDLITSLIKDREYIRRIPFETDRFAAIPSVGPVAPGHTLLCPKWHVRSFAVALGPGPDQAEVNSEYHRADEELTRLLYRLYSKPIHRFEHGSSPGGGRVVCTVEHAHVHLVPAEVDILPTILSEHRWEQVPRGFQDLIGIVEGAEYIYYETPDGRAFVTHSKAGFESQYLRRVFAGALGSPEKWDWRSVPSVSEVDLAYRKLFATNSPASPTDVAQTVS